MDKNVIDSKNLEIKKRKSVSFFRLQYTYAKKKDLLIIILGVIGSLASGVIALPLMSITFGGIINNFTMDRTGIDENIYDGIKRMSLQYFFIGIGYFFSGFLMIWMWSLLGRRISKRIKKDYFKVLMKQEQGFFEENDDILQYPTKIQAQIKKIENGVNLFLDLIKLGEKVGNTLMYISMIISSFVVGFTISWKLSLVLFSFVPCVILVVYSMVSNMRNSGSVDSKAYASAGAVAEEVINNIKTIASFSNFEYEIDRYTTNTKKSLKMGIKFGIYSGITMGCIYFLRYISYSLAVWFGGKLISEREYNNTVGNYFGVGDVFTVIFTIIFGSFSIGFAIPNITSISQAMTEANDLFELRKRKPKMDLSESIKKPEKASIRGEIKLENISFSYPKTPHIKLFENLNLNIEPFKVTALVGPSGSGKTSIVSLIERLYDVESGIIKIDSYNIKELDIKYYRSLIGYVPQEPVLFNQSIRDNIIFGRENITDEEIWDALRMSYADEFVKTEDDLDFIVGMKGGKLSGGQKQRIAIARAILTKPRILILDEATSALDYESEKIVQKALNKISRGITTIIVAHRLSTILNADKIIVLKKGKKVEEGNHTSLLKENKVYAELIKNQVGTVDFDYEELKIEDKEVEHIQRECCINAINVNNNFVHTETKLKVKKQSKSPQEILQEQVIQEKNKKEKIAKLAGEKTKKLWPILCKNPLYIVGALFTSLCAGGCWPAYGVLIAEAIQSLSNRNLSLVTTESFLVAMYFLALCGAAFFSYFAQGYDIILIIFRYIFSSVGENLTYHLRNMTFKKYLSLHMAYYDMPENKPHTLTTRLSSDTIHIKAIAFSMIGISMQAISTVLISYIIGFIFDWRLTLINLALVPIIGFTSILKVRIQKGFSNVDEVVDSSTGAIISESIINTKTIFCYNMQDVVVNLYLREIKAGAYSHQKASIINGFSYGFSQLLVYGSSSILFFVGATFLNNGSIEINNMFKTILVFLFAGYGIGQSQQYIGDIGRSRAAIINLFSTIDEPSLINPLEIRDRVDPPAIKPESIKGKIEFRNVVFAYPSKPDHIVLNCVNFIIMPGQKSAFVGYSGSGKSTIVQLIERFYDPNSGSILIDDIDIKDYDLITLRSFVSVVMQEPVIFNRSNYENIQYGNLKANNEQIQQAAERANISEMIQPDHDRQIPSGGQKQRLAIARAILKNPSILLLDEATSALDSKNETEIQNTLDSIMDGRTTITIAHKLSTVENSHVIFLMEKGQISEYGTHYDLLAKKKKYYNLYNYGNSAVNKFQ